MKKSNRVFIKIACAIFVGMTVCHVQQVLAGASGAINGQGVGWAAANVSNAARQTNQIATPANISIPSVSISPAAGYTYTAESPSGTSTNTYARLKATSLGGWSKRVNATIGDGADNPELEKRLKINPANCASLTMDSIIDHAAFNANGHSGNVEVTATATAGTALWLRGFEYTGGQSLPVDEPSTELNETIEFLKMYGTWKFETLIAGPFDFGGNGTNGCPLLIPFTLDSTNIANLIIVVDSVAKSVPFTIACASDVTFKCRQPVKFPVAEVTGGCGSITGKWSKEENYDFPVGTTPVTVTVTDGGGDSTTCTFNVIITDSEKPVKPTLPNLTYSLCNGTPAIPPTPTTTDGCAGTISGTTTNVFPITNLGTTVVTWTFDDKNGNVTTANQNVTLGGLTFAGFYSPINGTGGSCTNPVVTKSTSSTLPIKFDIKCGTTAITTGTPPVVRIQAYSASCAAGGDVVVTNAVYQNDWHYNWNVSGRIGGTYKITIELPDGTSQYVFVKLKN